ncbi:unnamed protein product [Dibothriocephalus latus]|uniref:Uncharacterized protein n=1 Tax=Dibothriocephalus latus TaxID=60516 RepID=A0A3P7LUB2_DIBLA|nr:unnamed protein product [Dibothriocephalus latus]
MRELDINQTWVKEKARRAPERLLEDLEESKEALLRKQRLLQTELEETQQTLQEQQRERQHQPEQAAATLAANLYSVSGAAMSVYFSSFFFCLQAEAKCLATQRQNSELASRVEELEENLEDMSTRHRRSVIGASASSPSLSAYVEELSQATEERNSLRQEVADLQERLKAAANERAGVSISILVLYIF